MGLRLFAKNINVGMIRVLVNKLLLSRDEIFIGRIC